MSRFKLTPQQEAALALDRNIAVSAGAGSGKTRVLVERYLAILNARPDISARNIVAITFTRKAASEMRGRIRQRIRGLLAEEKVSKPERRRYVTVLDELARAPINTIHGFAAEILREFAIPAGLDPGFTVLEEDPLSRPMQTAANRAMHRIERDDPESYRTALHFWSLDALRDRICEFAGNAVRMDRLEQQVRTPVDVDGLIRDRLAGFNAAEWLTIIGSIPEESGKTAAQTRQQLLESLSAMQDAESTETLCAALEIMQSVLFTKSGGMRSTGRMKSMGPVVEELQQTLDFLLDILSISANGEHFARMALTALIPLVRAARDEWVRLRRHTGMLTFDDLETETRRLLLDHPGADAVIKRLQHRYRYFMVDEFQDTNAIQWDIIRPLVSDTGGTLLNGRLFIVGDPKQSIYGFRNADITVFNHVRQRIVDTNRVHGVDSLPAEQAPGDIHMVSNFRSRPAILEFTDSVCGPVMTGGEAYEADYESLLADRDISKDRPEDCGRVGILIPGEEAVDSDEPSAGAWLKLMTGHMSAMVRNGACRWRDIAVMFPRRTRLDAIKTACRTAGIPFMVYKGIGFWQQPAIRDLTALVRWLADAGDRTALVTVLRSPLFNVSDAGLVVLSRHWREFPDGSPNIDCLDADAGDAPLTWPDPQALQRAQALLLRIRDGAGVEPLARIVERILADSGGWGSYAAEDDSGQVIANIEKFLDILTGMDREGVAPLWETARTLSDREAYDDQEGEAIQSTGNDRITLLTVHAAKGLEFPVVYLADIEQKPQHRAEPVLIDNSLGVGLRLPALNPEMPSYETVLYRRLKQRRIQRETAERKRLMYVAFTRARDRLFLVHRPSKQADIFSPKPDGNRWMDWIGNVLGDIDIEQIRDVPDPPERSIEFPDLNAVKAWVERPEAEVPRGTVQIPAGEETVFTTAVTTIRDFLFDREEYVKKHVLHMTDHFRSPESDPGRDVARKLGDAYHHLMETYPALEDTAVAAACDALASALSRDPEPLRRNAVRRLERMAVQSRSRDLFDTLQHVRGLHESPFNIYLKSGIVHGIIDLLIPVDGIWHVVDYKTDQQPTLPETLPEWLENHRREHEFQMSVYALSVWKSHPDQTTVPVDIYFADPGETVRYAFSRNTLADLEERLESILREMKTHGIPVETNDGDS